MQNKKILPHFYLLLTLTYFYLFICLFSVFFGFRFLFWIYCIHYIVNDNSLSIFSLCSVFARNIFLPYRMIDSALHQLLSGRT